MEIKKDLKYTKDHEWLKVEGEKAKIGISDYAQSELGDVVFVDLPEIGKKVSKGDSLLTIESVKAVSDVYAPVSGEVVEVNESLTDSPEKINSSPYDEGWMVVILPENASEVENLLDFSAYNEFTDELSK